VGKTRWRELMLALIERMRDKFNPTARPSAIEGAKNCARRGADADDLSGSVASLKSRMRVGEIVAGPLVINEPKTC